MRVIALLRRRPVEAAWAAFAAANLVAMGLWPGWETIPFHFIWISLTIVYGFRVWRPAATNLTLAAVIASTGALILQDAFEGLQLWGELFEVPLMSAMFLAMVWHARRRQDALAVVERQAAQRASLLERQERFLHDASHELRTPVTIARGHLEVLRRTNGHSAPEIEVALDELQRIEEILERLLLLAKADQPDFVVLEEVELEPFLEDVFMRWSEVAPRAWQLGDLAPGVVAVDLEGLRCALDALLENAVKYTEHGDAIELSSRAEGGEVVIEVADAGCGIPQEGLAHIWERFGRADAARTRTHGGVGLGLAIVDAIARAHWGSCTVTATANGSKFALRLPSFWRGEPTRWGDSTTRREPEPAAGLESDSRGHGTGIPVHPR
jgi:signal transduction histidine kinase